MRGCWWNAGGGCATDDFRCSARRGIGLGEDAGGGGPSDKDGKPNAIMRDGGKSDVDNGTRSPMFIYVIVYVNYISETRMNQIGF